MIYFIGGWAGPIKIGETIDVSARLKQLQACSPSILFVLATAPGGVLEERELHKRFNAARSHFEWFHRTSDLCRFINQMRNKHGYPAYGVLPSPSNLIDEWDGSLGAQGDQSHPSPELDPKFKEAPERIEALPLAYSINDACRALGVGRTVLYERIGRGEIKVRKVGARTLVPAESLQKFLGGAA